MPAIFFGAAYIISNCTYCESGSIGREADFATKAILFRLTVDI